MAKLFLSANDYLRDIWRLAKLVLDDDQWHPTCILALWRGGAPVGVAIHEYLAYHDVKLRHMPLKCYSYTGIGENAGNVVFEGEEAVFAALGRQDRVLVVDDVFDTGKTALAMHVKLTDLGIEYRLACTYWKPSKNTTNLKPDYFVRDVDDSWIVFPHEMQGLTPEEIKQKDPYFR